MEPSVSGARRRAALIFIFVVVALDLLAFGIIIPVLPHLIEDFVGGDVAKAAWWVGVFGSLFAAVQFVCSPIQGTLSDRFGRRPVILISCLGLGLDFMLMALVNTLPLLLIGRVISGITAASFTTAHAYIADVTPPDKRAGSYGLLGAAFGLGFIVGPALGGWLGSIDVRLPFWFAAGLALTNFFYGLFVLPESLPKDKRSARFEWRHANPIGALHRLRRYPHVLGIVGVLFLSMFAHYVFPSTFVLYADYRYGWDQGSVGYVLALVGVCSAIVQAGLVGRVVARIGERNALLVGLGCGVAGLLIYGLASSGLWFLMGIPIGAMWGLVQPSAQALVTRDVDPSEQGRLQGAVMSVASLAGIVSPFLLASVFAGAIGPYAHWELPGAAFLVAAALLFAALLLAWRVARPHTPTDRASVETPPVPDVIPP